MVPFLEWMAIQSVSRVSVCLATVLNLARDEIGWYRVTRLLSETSLPAMCIPLFSRLLGSAVHVWK